MRAWPVTGTAAGKLSTSPGEFPTAATLRTGGAGSWADAAGFLWCEGHLIRAGLGRGRQSFAVRNEGWGFPSDHVGSKKRRDESQRRNVPSAAQHMHKYHSDDVISRADIFVCPCSLKTTLPLSRAGAFLYMDSLLMRHPLLEL